MSTQTDRFAGWIVENKDLKGTPDFELIAKAFETSVRNDELLEEERLAELEPDFIDQVEEFGKGIPSGAIGLLESAALGGAALLSDENEESARETIQSVAASARSPFSADEGSEDAVGRKFGEATGSFVGLGATALIPGVGIPAAAALAAGAGAGEARERARAGGATYDERARATGFGTLVGLSELIPLGKLKALRDGIGENTLDLVVDRLKRAGVAAGFEGAQEAAAGIAQNLIEQGIYNPEQGTFTDTGEAFGYGAGVGGLVQGLLDLVAPRKRGPDGDGAGDAADGSGTQGELVFDDDPSVSSPDVDGADVTSVEAEAEAALLEEEQLAEAAEAAATETVTLAGEQYTLSEVVNLPRSAIRGWSEADQAEVERIQGEVQTTNVPVLKESGLPVEEYTAEQLEAVRRSQQRTGSTPETDRAEALAKEEAIRAVNVPKVIAEKTEDQRLAVEREAIRRFEEETSTAEETVEADTSTGDLFGGLAETQAAETQAAEALKTKQQETGDLFPDELDAKPLSKKKEKELPRSARPSTTDSESILDDTVEEDTASESNITGDMFAKAEQKLLEYTPPPEGSTPEQVETALAKQQAAVTQFYADLEKADVDAKAKETLLKSVDAANQKLTNKEQYDAAITEGFTLGKMQQKEGDLFPIELDQARTQEATEITTPEAAPAAAPEPIRQKVSRKFLGDLFIPPSSAFYKRLVSKDESGKPRTFTPDELRTRVRVYGMARSTSAKSKRAIQEYLTSPQSTKGAFTTVTPAAQQSMELQTKRRTPAQMETARKKKATEKKREETNAKAKKRRAAVKAAKTEEAKAAENLVKGGVPSDVAVITATASGVSNPLAGNEKQLQRSFKKEQRASVKKALMEKITSNSSDAVEAAVELKELLGPFYIYYDSRLQNVAKNTNNNKLAQVLKRPDVLNAPISISARMEAAEKAAREMVRKFNKEKAPSNVRYAKALAFLQKDSVGQTALYPFVKPAKFLKKIKGLASFMGINANPDLNAPLNEETVSLIREGNTKEALLAMAKALPNTSEFAALKRNARALAQRVGETKVFIVPQNPTNQVERIYKDYLDGEADGSGIPANGVYIYDAPIPELDNVILLDSKLGLSASTLIHEMTHATTQNFIDTNPKSPYVIQLKELYETTKKYSYEGDTAYGLTNIHEFVAEAFGNAAFQEQLSRIPTDGSSTSIWQKFKTLIHNILSALVGRSSGTVPINSVRLSDEANRVISLILSPAPGQQGIGVLQDSAQYPTEGVLRQVNQAYRGASLTPSERTALSKAIAETQYGASNLSLEFFFKTLPMQAMADVAGYYNEVLGTLAGRLNTLMLNQRAALSEADAQSTASARQIRNWTKSVWWNPASKKSDERVAEIAMLDNIAGISTVEEVDPRLSKTQAEKEYGKGSDKMVIWQSMRKDWNAIGPEGREVYNNMVKTYAKLYKKLVASLESRLNDTDIEAETRQKLKGVYKKMLVQKLQPYLPLRRSGKFRLAFDAFNKDTNSTEPVFLMFETNVERQDYIDRVLSTDKDVVKNSEGDPKYDTYNTAKGGYRGAAPSTGFINDLLKAIPKVDGKKSQAMEDAIIEGFINALPQTSFAKGFQKRQNIAGFTGQFTGEFANNIYDLNRKIVRMDYSGRILNLQNEIGEVRGLDNKGDKVRQSLMERADFARNPPADAWAQTFNRYAFLFTIGFNASSALVNLSQLPLIIYPMLAGRYGPVEASRAMMAASGMITRSGFSKVTQPLVSMKGIESVESRAMPSITNMYTMTEDGNFTVRKGLNLSSEKRAELEALIPLVKAATSTNALVSTSLFDYTGVNQGSTNQSAMDLVTTGSAFMFHSVEQYNRQVTLIATYNLELARVKKEQPTLTTQAQRELAAENSLLRTQEYNGGAVLETASPFAQKSVGRVALMYKGFGIQMYYTLLKATRQFMLGTIDGKKVEGARSEAFKQLMGVHGSALFFSGVQGLPIYGSIALLGNLILDDDEDSFEELTRKAIGSEAWYKGFASALLGVDISQRVALTNLVLQANRYSSGDRAPEELIVQALSGPAGSVALQGYKGFEEAISGDGPDSLRRGIERMTPAAIKNGLKAARYSEDDGVLTRRKDPILEDITVGQLFAQVAGFAPNDYTKNQEEVRNIKRIDTALRTTRSKLLRKNNLARFYGDAEEQASVKKEIEAYNKRISKNFPKARITMGTLGRSRRAFRTQTRKMVNGVQLSENVRRPLIDFMEDQVSITADFED